MPSVGYAIEQRFLVNVNGVKKAIQRSVELLFRILHNGKDISRAVDSY
jgi:hypothetical protein